MAKYTIAADGAATKADSNLLMTVLTSPVKAIKSDDAEALSGSDLQMVALGNLGLGIVGGGYLARRRAEAGKPAMGGFFL